MKHKLINFDWIVNKLIIHNLLINYQNLKKRINTEAAAHDCSVAVLKKSEAAVSGSPCLKLVRIMLETWNLVRKYTRIFGFRKYTF